MINPVPRYKVKGDAPQEPDTTDGTIARPGLCQLVHETDGGSSPGRFRTRGRAARILKVTTLRRLFGLGLQCALLTTFLFDRCPRMTHHNLAIIRGDRKNPTLKGPALQEYRDLYDYLRRLWSQREERRYGSIVEPILQVLGRVFFVGEKAGLGQTLKLANNLMSQTAIAITAEALALGVKAGLDPQVMLDVLNASSGRNTASADKFPNHVLPRRFDFGFSTGLALKDVRLCLEEAAALDAPITLGAAVQQLLAETQDMFGPDSDCTCVARTVEARAGCELSPQRGSKS